MLNILYVNHIVWYPNGTLKLDFGTCLFDTKWFLYNHGTCKLPRDLVLTFFAREEPLDLPKGSFRIFISKTLCAYSNMYGLEWIEKKSPGPLRVPG